MSTSGYSIRLSLLELLSINTNNIRMTEGFFPNSRVNKQSSCVIWSSTILIDLFGGYIDIIMNIKAVDL
jgi:hypothetical protein